MPARLPMPVKPISPRVRQRLPARGTEHAWLLEIEITLPAVDPEQLLAGCEGFLVDDSDGRAIGMVDSVETDDTGLVTALVVATGWFGRRKLHVAVEAIDLLVPHERRVVLREAVSPQARTDLRSR